MSTIPFTAVKYCRTATVDTATTDPTGAGPAMAGVRGWPEVNTRPGGHVGYVVVSHGVELPGRELFISNLHLHGGPAPVRRFLPQLVDLIWNRTIDPGKVFDLELPLGQAAEGHEAMDECRAIKVLRRP
jgi:hypothetical protein